MTIMLDSFDSRKLVFINPIHEFLWTSSFVRDFLNFLVKEESFGILDYSFELLPIFDMFGQLIFFKVSIILFIPPSLRVHGDINNL